MSRFSAIDVANRDEWKDSMTDEDNIDALAASFEDSARTNIDTSNWPIKKCDSEFKKHVAEFGYDDSRERNAFISILTGVNNMLAQDHIKDATILQSAVSLQCLIKAYFNIELYCEKTRKIVPDPYGKRQVDFAITVDDEIVGLIDVERFQKWKTGWPDNYTKLHFLERKVKYFDDKNLPFLNFAFNSDRTTCLAVGSQILKGLNTSNVLIKDYINQNIIADEVRKVDFNNTIAVGINEYKIPSRVFYNYPNTTNLDIVGKRIPHITQDDLDLCFQSYVKAVVDGSI